jgi:23S rRNA (uracil1939-C5)-methyltransferase
MSLAIRREGATLRIGLHRRRSTEIVDMHACPILHPTLFQLVQALRPVLLRLDGLRQQGEASVNLLDSGPDLLLRTDADLSAADRTALAELARRQGVPRISWARAGVAGAEPAAVLGPAVTSFSGWNTEVPPGAFLQASHEGEQAIVDAVMRALPQRLKRGIVELFAGCGSLSHALSTRGRITAYEGDAEAVRALRRAGNPRVNALVRDLARQPLTPQELNGAGAIVLDPPYAGAAAQMPALAASEAPIVYVSCNPGALARDARLLAAAGYEPMAVEAIDQFLWSSQVETVAGFRKRLTR